MGANHHHLHPYYLLFATFRSFSFIAEEFFFFQPAILVPQNILVPAFGAFVRFVQFGTGIVTSAYHVVEKRSCSGMSQVFKFHLLHMDAGERFVIVPFHHQPIVGLVVKVGRTTDIVHLRAWFAFGQRITVDLPGMCHKNAEAMVLGDEIRQFVQHRRKVLRLRLSRLRGMVETVQRVPDKNAASFARHQFAAFGQYGIRGGILFEGNVADVFGKELPYLQETPLIHATIGQETASREFLGEFAQVVDDGDVFGAEESDFPLVAQTEAEDEFVPFLFRHGKSKIAWEAFFITLYCRLAFLIQACICH